MLLRRRICAGDRGFTLVEVMVAVALLIIGVLGTITMVTGANAQTAVTKSREGGVNLARQVIDAARGVDYNNDLTPSGIAPALQGQPGLADADAGTAGWQINRRGVIYTIASVPVCIIDAAADGFGAHPTPSDPAAPGYCAGQTTGSQDANPDDFRRMDVNITWKVGGRNYSLRDTTLIINPSGGIGPTVKSLCAVNSATDASCPATALGAVTNQGTTSLNFLALTSVADTTTWTRDDGAPDWSTPNPEDVNTSNPSASSGTAWNYTWNIGSPDPNGANICSTDINWTLDGNYIVNAQAVSGIGANGVPGQLKPLTVTINRNEPYPVCGLSGGFDQMTATGHPVGVDLEWLPNPERDVIGYEVIRLQGGADPSNKTICDTSLATSFPYTASGCVCTSQTACIDTSPRNTGGTVAYEVTALDRDGNGNPRPTSTNPAVITVDQGGNDAPTFSGATISGATITWPAASDPDGILYYRIYRGGTGYTNRYEELPGTATSYTDPAPSATGNTYYVTAVDTKYNESAPVQAVAGP
jgi:type II secretory pathway pseudopilin PulG